MQKHIGATSFSLIAALVFASSAHAFFDLYNIREIYSSADGSVQFVELYTVDVGQFFLDGHTLTASQGTSSSVFTFVGLGPSPTANRPLLLATPAFSAECGIVPDYTLETGFLFEPNGSVDFGPAADIVSYTALPLDGTTSLNFPGGIAGTNSPENFAGDTCTLGAQAVPSAGALLLFVLPFAAGIIVFKRSESYR